MRVLLSSAVVACTLTMSASAAGLQTITGKLSSGGYTVIALAANGTATSVRTANGKFTLTARASVVTLHLRDARGNYAGPIVVAGAKKRAIMGVKAGAKLGKIVVRRGYARTARVLPRRWRSSSRWAQARKGVPIGAGNFGFVRSSVHAAAGPGLDEDRDGVPNALDVDDNGNLVLDNLERTAGASRATAGLFSTGLADAGGYVPDLASTLAVPLKDTVNANAGPASLAQLDSVLAADGFLRIGHPDGSDTELDCGTLSYCSTGGTGRIAFSGTTPDPPFPDCCDPDHNGWGAMPVGAFGPNQFFLWHGANSEQIKTGDVLIEHRLDQQYPVTLQTVFATVPALIRYQDGAGHDTAVTYPVPPPYTGDPGGHPPFPVSAQPSGDVIVTFTFWRPQRKPIGSEAGDWTDIGGLFYHVDATPLPASPPKRAVCPPSSYSTTDPNLFPDTIPFSPEGGFRDKLADQPADPTHTHSFTVNLTQCLASAGLTWNVGGYVELHLQAGGNAYDQAIQRLAFTRES